MMRCALLLALAATAAAPAPAGSLRLPLDPPLAVTSSFGEFRRGHYHGGLDFSTGGKEGLSVHAPESGWVYRVRASGIGYGRSVYFRLEDGRTVVFGHLSRFHPRVAAVVESEQDRLGSYEVDLYPKPRSLTFARGEVLAYTGSSGAGPPHLHAEIRTGSEAAVAENPLREGWDVADSVPPTLNRLRVEPARAGVLVDGGIDPVILPLTGADRPRSLAVTGPVRLWIDAEDRASGGGYRLAPQRVGFTVDEVTKSEVRFSEFNWEQAREVEWTFDASVARNSSQRWIRLEAPPGVRSSVAYGLTAGEDWTRDLRVGSHVLLLYAIDAGGGVCTAELRLDREAEGGTTPRIPVGLTGSEFTSRGSYLELRLKGRAGIEEIGATAASGDELEGGWTTFSVGGGTVAQLERPDPAVPGLWSFHTRSAAGDSLVGRAMWTGWEGGARVLWARLRTPWVDAGAFRIRLEPGTTYGETWITVEEEAGLAPRSASQPELIPRSGRLFLGPWGSPLREDLTVAGNVDGSTSRRGLALYSWEGGEWNFEGADTALDGVSASLGSLESIALLEDLTPPAVTVPPPEPGSVRRLLATVRDHGAGVSAAGVRMLLDGRSVVAEWDPEAERLTGFLRAPLPRGEHEIVVEATDRVGNRSEARRRIGGS